MINKIFIDKVKSLLSADNRYIIKRGQLFKGSTRFGPYSRAKVYTYMPENLEDGELKEVKDITENEILNSSIYKPKYNYLRD